MEVQLNRDFKDVGCCPGLSQEYRDIVNLINTAHLEMDSTELRRKVIPLVADMFHVERIIFFLADTNWEKLSLADTITLNIDEELKAKYAQGYWRYDPV